MYSWLIVATCSFYQVSSYPAFRPLPEETISFLGYGEFPRPFSTFQSSLYDPSSSLHVEVLAPNPLTLHPHSHRVLPSFEEPFRGSSRPDPARDTRLEGVARQGFRSSFQSFLWSAVASIRNVGSALSKYINSPIHVTVRRIPARAVDREIRPPVGSTRKINRTSRLTSTDPFHATEATLGRPLSTTTTTTTESTSEMPPSSSTGSDLAEETLPENKIENSSAPETPGASSVVTSSYEATFSEDGVKQATEKPKEWYPKNVFVKKQKPANRRALVEKLQRELLTNELETKS